MPRGPRKPAWTGSGKMSVSLSLCGVKVEGCWKSTLEAASEGSGNLAPHWKGITKSQRKDAEG